MNEPVQPLPPRHIPWTVIYSFLFSIILFNLVAAYNLSFDHSFSLWDFNLAFASTGYLLVGISFAASGLSHFIPSLRSLMEYRKYYGLWGYMFAFLHTAVSVALLPFPAYYLQKANLIPFFSALIAFLIFTVMAVISNNKAIRFLGGKVWRTLLHVGYIAFILIMIHFGVKEYQGWLAWLQNQQSLPPISIILFLFGIAVLVLRIVLQLSFLKKKPIQIQVQPAVTSPTVIPASPQ